MNAARLKVATYNIHSCVGPDGRCDPGRTAKVLAELDADLIALQELERPTAAGPELLELLVGGEAFTLVSATTFERRGRSYGNALLTRLPILATRQIDLSLPHREPRCAIDADLRWGPRTARVVATHLGLWPTDRGKQIRRLLTALEPGSADSTLLLGDLNEWELLGRQSNCLCGYFSPTPRHRTFPSRWPLLALDRIWVRPPGRLTDIRVHSSPLARLASDHLPLTASLERPVASSS